jgi:hypothetical protein
MRKITLISTTAKISRLLKAVDWSRRLIAETSTHLALLSHLEQETTFSCKTGYRLVNLGAWLCKNTNRTQLYDFLALS